MLSNASYAVTVIFTLFPAVISPLPDARVILNFDGVSAETVKLEVFAEVKPLELAVMV